MSYIEILRERIAAREVTFSEAVWWLVRHGMDFSKAWRGLAADSKGTP
jgi:hypothetical protein